VAIVLALCGLSMASIQDFGESLDDVGGGGSSGYADAGIGESARLGPLEFELVSAPTCSEGRVGISSKTAIPENGRFCQVRLHAVNHSEYRVEWLTAGVGVYTTEEPDTFIGISAVGERAVNGELGFLNLKPGAAGDVIAVFDLASADEIEFVEVGDPRTDEVPILFEVR
jgi:hypothetical protein